MPPVTMKKNSLSTVLLCITCIVALVNFKILISPSLTSFYAYSISACLFAIYIIIRLVASQRTAKAPISWPVLAFIAWAMYMVINAAVLNQGWGTHHSYIISNVLLLLAAGVLFTSLNYPVGIVLKMIVIFSFGESLVCLLQFAGVAASYNKLFSVTGTWSNPNVTAMFLAMVQPALVCLMLEAKSGKKGWLVAAQVVNIVVLCLLGCRTAFAGAILSTMIVLQYQLQLFKRIKERFSLFGTMALLAAALVVLGIAGWYAYNVKKASADGRMLVWKTAWHMIGGKPVTGYGYGQFERDYNLFQAAYFNSGVATAAESAHADHVKMAYNELLENAVEGGSLGVIFLMAVAASLLIFPLPAKRKDNRVKEAPVPSPATIAAYAGIVSFLAMSLVNFTIQAIPVMYLFILYAAFLIGNSRFIPVLVLPSSTGKAYYFSLLASASVLLFVLVQQVNAHLQLKQAAAYGRKKHYKQALATIQPLEHILERSESYWSNYAYLLLQTGQYSQSLDKLQKARQLSSDPALFMQSGFCYEAMGQLNLARSEYNIAKCITPSHVVPLYAFMRLCVATKDTTEAVAAAREIIALQPKTASPQTDQIKKEAAVVAATTTFNTSKKYIAREKNAPVHFVDR